MGGKSVFTYNKIKKTVLQEMLVNYDHQLTNTLCSFIVINCEILQ